MGFKHTTVLDSYKEGRKEMGFGRSKDLKSYKNKSIKAEESWVTTDLDWFVEGRKNMRSC